MSTSLGTDPTPSARNPCIACQVQRVVSRRPPLGSHVTVLRQWGVVDRGVVTVPSTGSAGSRRAARASNAAECRDATSSMAQRRASTACSARMTASESSRSVRSLRMRSARARPIGMNTAPTANGTQTTHRNMTRSPSSLPMLMNGNPSERSNRPTLPSVRSSAVHSLLRAQTCTPCRHD